MIPSVYFYSFGQHLGQKLHVFFIFCLLALIMNLCPFLQIDTLLDPGLPKVSDSTRGSFHLHGCQVVAQGGNCWYCVSRQVHELAPL